MNVTNRESEKRSDGEARFGHGHTADPTPLAVHRASFAVSSLHSSSFLVTLLPVGRSPPARCAASEERVNVVRMSRDRRGRAGPYATR